MLELKDGRSPDESTPSHEAPAQSPTQEVTGAGRRRRWLRRVAIAALLLVVTLGAAVGGLYLWALTATDSSLLARALLWGESDVDDWKRFPSRAISAGSEPVTFRRVTQGPLDDLEIDGKPLAAFLEETNTTAFIVLHGDELLYEGYFNGSSRESTQTSMSVAKSFLSTLVGIAIAEGHISGLDDPITMYLPELLDRDARFGEITIRHLLTMSSGLRYREWFSPWDDPTTTYYAPNLRSVALDKTEIEERPGRQFLYNDYNPLLIGMVLERATGMTVSEWLESRLWRPMGAEADASWSLDSERSGSEKMQAGLNAQAIDFAKLGWLFLNDGRSYGRQVVPVDWVAEATRRDVTTDPAPHYQYF